MKFPNWIKICLWASLLLLTTVLLLQRFYAIIGGVATSIDTVILLVFVGVILTPILSEVEFLGVKFKKDIEELRRDLSIRIGDLKNEVRSSQHQIVNNTIQSFGPPPSDDKLPELEKRVAKLMKHQHQDSPKESNLETTIDVPQQNIDLFKVRFSVERELRRIWFDKFDPRTSPSGDPLHGIMRDLREAKIINTELYTVLKEVMAICNYAVHNKQPSVDQFKFVERNAPFLLSHLQEL